MTRGALVAMVSAWERHIDSGKKAEGPPCPPSLVVIDGKRKRYVGIGWVDEGKPRGDEPVVIT